MPSKAPGPAPTIKARGMALLFACVWSGTM